MLLFKVVVVDFASDGWKKTLWYSFWGPRIFHRGSWDLWSPIKNDLLTCIQHDRTIRTAQRQTPFAASRAGCRNSRQSQKRRMCETNIS